MAADVVTVVNGGLDLITALLAASDIKYIHFGTGTTGAAVADTALETASSEARTSGVQTQETTTTADDTYQCVGTVTASGGARAITEVGLFDASTAGNMLLRGTFDVINLQDSDGIAFTIQIVTDQA